ncbi:MAG: hypothetical protein L6R39_005142 [Caloplaca ligustica]|nr:MAG: hypothetical protein L6R39_005142 [Caloplaca ligustica]
MAASETATLTRTHTNSADEYDHSIKLLDTTKPKADPAQISADDVPGSSGVSLTRRWTRGTLRKELAKRKYAKWQEDKSQSLGDPEQSDADPDQTRGEEQPPSAVTARDTGGLVSRLNRKRAAGANKEGDSPKEARSQVSIIDVLYENQRGWFLFGMPLYSANSLLNFDPAPWQNSTFQDSPVNITNAQVPDPSWKWAWKNWYVDMSHDVDEEGWEYSFSFQPRFAWHGSHPWFHSFARRRRWLRKRVKLHPSRIAGGKGAMKEGHLLNADYFTIHGAKRDRSPDSSAAETSANRSSYLGYDGPHESDDSEQGLNDIPNVIALLAVLKKATVDREKIVALRTFLAQGGEELHYLADNMGEIMGLMIYQTSRQQLLDQLLESLDKTKDRQASAGNETDVDRESLQRNLASLSKAIDVARAYLDGLDYWRDASDNNRRGKSPLTVDPAFGNNDMDWPEETKAHIQGANTDNEIRGIPKDADVDVAPSLLRTAQGQAEGSATGTVNKGKEKEKS